MSLQGFANIEKERKLQYQWYHNFRSYVVPVAGLEPARCRHRWILSFLDCLDFRVILRNPTESKTIKKTSDSNAFFNRNTKKACTPTTMPKLPICLFFQKTEGHRRDIPAQQTFFQGIFVTCDKGRVRARFAALPLPLTIILFRREICKTEVIMSVCFQATRSL